MTDSVQEKMEEIWRTTCETWENCNETTVQSFLSGVSNIALTLNFALIGFMNIKIRFQTGQVLLILLRNG